MSFIARLAKCSQFKHFKNMYVNFHLVAIVVITVIVVDLCNLGLSDSIPFP